MCWESFVPVGLLVWVCWEIFVPEMQLRLLVMSVCLCVHCPCGRLASGGEKFRMQFPHDTNRCTLKNRRISTIRLQYLKYAQGNCMRNYRDAVRTQHHATTRPTVMEGAGGSGGLGRASRRGLAAVPMDNGTRTQYPQTTATPGPSKFRMQFGLVWFCGPGVLRVVGCYWWCCAHWRAYWLGESQPSALWGCSSL